MDKNRRLAPPLNSINKEDIEEGSLQVAEISSFVQVDFESLGDAYGNTSTSASANNSATVNPLFYAQRVGAEPEVDKKGYRVIWAENIRSGELVPIRFREGDIGDSLNGNVEGGDLSEGEDEDDKLPLLPPSLNSQQDTSANNSRGFLERASTHANIIIFLRIFYLFFQGTVAGFSFSTLYVYVNASSTASFLSDYQPNADEFRRLFYILTTISAVGSINAVLTSLSQTRHQTKAGGAAKGKDLDEQSSYESVLTVGSGKYVALAFVTAALHFVVFVVSVIMAQTDTLISRKFGSSDTDWASGVASTTLGSSLVEAWVGLNTVRFICSLVAWVGVCFLIWQDLFVVVEKNVEIQTLRDSATAWRYRAALLEGQQLEDLDLASLRRLVALQSIGLERSRDALALQSKVGINN